VQLDLTKVEKECVKQKNVTNPISYWEVGLYVWAWAI